MDTQLEDVSMSDEMDYDSYEDDVEAELEVDQLDSSESDQELNAAASTTSTAKKATSGKPGQRVPGHTLLPAVRIENILQADGVTGNLALSKEGQFVLSIATEEFIKRLAQAGLDVAKRRQPNLVSYLDMAVIPPDYPEFHFLRETIPEPISLQDALAYREARLKELREEDPALGGLITTATATPSYAATPDPVPSISTSTKSSKSKKTNGKEKQPNGHLTAGSDIAASTESQSAPRRRSRLALATTQQQPHSGRLRLKREEHTSGVHSAQRKEPHINGRADDSPRTNDSPAPKEEEVESEGDDSEPPWPAPAVFTGPASAFLQGPAAPFGRSPNNPGRTIYSQTNQPD